MASKTTIRIIALVISLVLALLGNLALADTQLGRVFFDAGGDLGFINIQTLMWVFFFLGMGELYYRYQANKVDVAGLHSRYLTEEMGVFYNQTRLAEVMQRVQNREDRLARLIKILFMRYQASQRSPDETHQMLNSQLEMMQFKLEVDYNLIRYISWLIPTLGFIGTVVGITLALSYAGEPGVAETPEFLGVLTSKLAVAFHTTLVALIMSAVLVYAMHVVQGQEETVIQHCGEYCLNNFINKLMSN